MSDLTDLSLQPSYHKGEDNIARDFYVPCMKASVGYDRAIGFFRSSIYLIAWEGLRKFVSNGGEMRIVCSPVMADADSEAIEKGYLARSEGEIAKTLNDTISQMLESSTLQKPTKVLAALVAEGVTEFKIATMEEETSPRFKRLFHDKVGIFRDGKIGNESMNQVVFKGSMNETWAGLSMDGNLESIDVYLSWGDNRERKRVESEQAYFNSLWDNEYSSVSVRNFPDLPKHKLISAAEGINWQELVDDIVEEINASESLSPDSGPNPRTPLPHQNDALESWEERGRRGIFEHATGSGKTFTALCAIRKSLQRNEVPLILVPSTDLLSQWKGEVETTNQDIDPKILVCGGGENKWRKNGLLRSWTRPRGSPRIVLSTIQTAITEDFRSLLQTGDHLFIVVDEVHRVGSPEHRKILEYKSGPRLGLSATPHRAGDPEGTEAIMDYFEGVVQPPFTLSDAIDSGMLTPYFYHVHTVSLTPAEQEEWEDETKKIARLYARLVSDDNSNPSSSERLKRLLIRRANIVKQAQNKIQLSKRVLDGSYEPGDRWLVYCSDMDQLQRVMDVLQESDYNVMEFHSKMSGDRDQTLKYFENNGGVIVSIKCLDEGIDIPNATHALILASSKNPREFIQRRGRVLRKSDNKNFAHVHDAVVLPHKTDVESPVASILEGELSRAIKFGEDAVSSKAVADLRSVAIEAGIDIEETSKTGFEGDSPKNE